MAKDSTAPRTGRPKKGQRRATHPHLAKNPDFPLSFHKGVGRFYKTHRGTKYYFGTDPATALERYKAEWPYIGQDLPVPESASTTVADLVNLWLEDRLQDAKAKAIEMKTWKQYREVGAFIVETMGRDLAVSSLGPDQFAVLGRAMNKRNAGSPSVGRRWYAIARMPWRWGRVNGKIDDVPMGSRFKPPSKADVRVKRHARGRQTYTADEVQKMLSTALPYMRAAILLACNGGYTQAEIAMLKARWVDLDAGVIDHLRSKTKAFRRVTLWPETVQALVDMPRYKPVPAARGLLFTTRNGKPYADDGANGIQQAFARLMVKHGVELEQSGFGKLRATHRTLSVEVGDDNAAKLVMGHTIGKGVDENYIRSISDERIQAVTDHVRAWLFPPG